MVNTKIIADLPIELGIKRTYKGYDTLHTDGCCGRRGKGRSDRKTFVAPCCLCKGLLNTLIADINEKKPRIRAAFFTRCSEVEYQILKVTPRLM